MSAGLLLESAAEIMLAFGTALRPGRRVLRCLQCGQPAGEECPGAPPFWRDHFVGAAAGCVSCGRTETTCAALLTSEIRRLIVFTKPLMSLTMRARCC
jgi:ribosomal protein S14